MLESPFKDTRRDYLAKQAKFIFYPRTPVSEYYYGLSIYPNRPFKVSGFDYHLKPLQSLGSRL